MQLQVTSQYYLQTAIKPIFVPPLLNIYVYEGDTAEEEEMEREWDFPTADSFSKWLQFQS